MLAWLVVRLLSQFGLLVPLLLLTRLVVRAVLVVLAVLGQFVLLRVLLSWLTLPVNRALSLTSFQLRSWQTMSLFSFPALLLATPKNLPRLRTTWSDVRAILKLSPITLLGFILGIHLGEKTGYCLIPTFLELPLA
jgi:hypothetical protein